jgi:transposase-like protein
LDNAYVVVLANCTVYSHSAGTNVTIDYALISGFIDGKMIERLYYETPSIEIIRDFISDISDALKSNPERRVRDMPKKELFIELVSKLSMQVKSAPILSVEEISDSSEYTKIDRSHYKKFGKEFKIATIKRIKENQLPIAQVAEEIGISCSSAIYRWITEYEKKGENAFKGRGRQSPNKGLLIDKLFQEAFGDVSVPDAAPGTDTNEKNSSSFVFDKKNMLKYRSYKQGEYKKEFKIKLVQLIKEHKLPLLQVSEKLDIAPSVLNRWVRAVEEYEGDAFPGRNANQHDKRNTDTAVPRADSSKKKKNTLPDPNMRKNYDKECYFL